MKVMKFGGTSVGNAERIRNVAGLVAEAGRNLVVVSAVTGTTNSLVEFSDYLYNGNAEGAKDVLGRLETSYRSLIGELYSTSEGAQKANEYVREVFAYLRTMSRSLFTPTEEKVALAQGELISSHLLSWYLEEMGVKVCLLPALEFMKTDGRGEPDTEHIRKELNAMIDGHPDAELFVTQGFICRNQQHDIDNLRRGGSDYTASLAGAAIGAEEIQIWTDIDGLQNSDPRIVENTAPVRHLHFDEAAELGYFGAKILHPTCIQPAKFANIPVRLLNTMAPSSPGTLIDNVHDHGSIKAVAAKGNITAISIRSSRMLLAHGFLRRVFEIFESWQTSIDMICTSEVGVSVSVDNTTHLNEIVHDLKKYGTVSVDMDMCIICVVGDMDWENVGFESRAMDAMKDIPVRMVSYGGSNYNISFLVKDEDKVRTLKSLSKCLFEKC